MRPVHRKWLRRLIDAVCLLVVALFSMLMGLVLLEYMAGCGALYTDSEGVRHVGECIWIPVRGD